MDLENIKQDLYLISMKHFSKIFAFFKRVNILAVVYPLLLIVPNILLDFTENLSLLSRIVNILLPLGFYFLVIASWRKVGWTSLFLFPFAVLASFQIVLLYLYGESIIAVDMFLNVVTTSVSEASELLGNLAIAIVVILVLYLPAIIWSIYSLVKKLYTTKPCRTTLSSIGVALLIVSGVLSIVGYTTERMFSLKYNVFPINVINNIKVAVDRTVETRNYPFSSAGFRYNSRATHDEDDREIYVMVIGETSRAINWQLNGYERETNPLLSRQSSLVSFDHALSQSNTTHKSVPMIMSPLSAINFEEIPIYKSIITAYKEAGFHTTFLSNQSPNRSYTEFFGNEADTVVYLPSDNTYHSFDGDLIKAMEKCISDTTYKKQFIVMHTYGSHFKYSERYPEQFSVFKPDLIVEASSLNRDNLINAYDNSIRYTDYCLNGVIELLKKSGAVSAMIYSSDHGEDIFDDSRERFLHASPVPTYYQLHVAMLGWLSDSYNDKYPQALPNMKKNAGKYVSSTLSVFNTILDLSGVETPYLEKQFSVADKIYTEPLPMYINDLNSPVMLRDCGIKKSDVAKFEGLGIL